MSSNPTPANTSPETAKAVDPVTQAAATQALLAELHRKTQIVLSDNPVLAKPAPDSEAK